SLDKLERDGFINDKISFFCRYVMALRTDNDKYRSLDNFEVDVLNEAIEVHKNSLLRTRNLLAHPPTVE
ncbi:TPA: hypothetical protein ACSP7Y_005257, partial [Serratia fonticola]